MSDEPLYQQLCRAIRDDIAAGRIAPGDRIPTVAALRKTHQVSHLTVLRAFRELADMGVIEACGRGYFASGGRNVAKSHCGCIGILLRPLWNYNRRDIYFNEINYGVQHECGQRELTMIVPPAVKRLNQVSIDPGYVYDEIIAAAGKMASQVDGFLFDERLPDDVILQIMQNTRRTGVMVNRASELDIDSVTPDNVGAVNMMMNAAVRLNYRKFIFCENGLLQYNGMRRAEAFRRFVTENSIAPEDYCFIEDHSRRTREETISDMRRAVEKMTAAGKTLLFANSDPYARSCCRDFAAWGLTPGRDIGVAGIDFLGVAELEHPYLATVDVDPVGIGRKVVELLVRRLTAVAGVEAECYHPDITFKWGETL